MCLQKNPLNRYFRVHFFLLLFTLHPLKIYVRGDNCLYKIGNWRKNWTPCNQQQHSRKMKSKQLTSLSLLTHWASPRNWEWTQLVPLLFKRAKTQLTSSSRAVAGKREVKKCEGDTLHLLTTLSPKLARYVRSLFSVCIYLALFSFTVVWIRI